MGNYEIDSEIVYAIKNGNHQYGKIWNKVKGIGSKQTFTNHLAQLVKDEVILRKIEDKIPHYYRNDVQQYEGSKLMIKDHEKKISAINNISKKVPDKKILDRFVKDTIRDLGYYSLFYFDTIIPHYESDKHIHRNNMKLLDEIIKARVSVLQERKPGLILPYNDLIKNQMFKKFNGELN